MIKSLMSLLLLAAASLLLQAQDKINIQMEVPGEVVAGEDFQVNIVIEKGRLEEFSRFQQEWPAGFTVVSENSGSADFSFENRRVRFIWLKLPAKSDISISYRVRINERLKGELTISGEFSYVENNERRSILLDEKKIMVSPSPDIAASDQVDVKDFAATMSTERAEMVSDIEVSAIRQVPYPSTTGNDIMVNLLVYKKDMNKFAKIEENIPDGFEAKSMESRDGLFTFKDGVAKFVWMNLPDGPGFTISYRLLPEPGKTIDDLKIAGTLSYIQDGRNVEVEVVQKDIDLAGITDDKVEAMMASLEGGEASNTKEPGKEKTGKEETVVKEAVVKETRPPAKTASSRIPAAQQLPVYNGVYFRVQLAATRNFQDARSEFESFRLSRPVLVEQHQGYYKYTAGSFPNYTEAQSFKNSALRKGIPGAFIVAYRDGRRIDIMDALQATGGK
jgi:hypothetical protein